MTFAGIARVTGFYLFLALVVLFAPGGAFFSYTVITLASVLFILASRSRPRPGNPLTGLVTGTLAISIVFGLMLALGATSVTGTGSDVAVAILFGIILQILVAIGEEISFRGYLLEDLRGQFGLPVAIVISSTGFAFLHISSMLSFGVNPVSGILALVNITAAGVILALLATRWGLLSAMGFHFTWNFFQYSVFGLGLSGQFETVLRLTAGSNVLLTGGEYGPEASLPGMLVIFAMLGIVWYFYRRPKKQATIQH